MSNVDERPVGEGGGGSRARPMLAGARGGFIERHELWSEAQYAAAVQLRRVVDEVGVELVRLSFVDQHGVLRGKSLTRDALPGALRDGITAPSSLLLKDTSGQSAYPVFSRDVGVGVEGFSGAGDIVLVPDPLVFRVLPWSPRTAWILCDLRFPDGAAVPFCTRSILRAGLERIAERGHALTIGVELEFHVFRAGSRSLSAEHVARPGAPGAAPAVTPSTPGSQLLHEEGLDSLDDLVRALHHGLTRVDLPLRSIELEFGPSQLEVTLAPSDAMRAADDVTLLRSAIRQIARREGYHATFMSRPAGAETASTGWHLHQSLRDLGGGSAFAPVSSGAVLSPLGTRYLGGLLAHAAAASAFTTPTINGYKRYRPLSLAPERAVWGVDNKGAMIRVVGAGETTRLENRSGEPAANPYLYIASQLISGLDGVDRELDCGPPSEDPYGPAAGRLPRSLAEALDALEGDGAFRAALGEPVLAWYLALKRAELERYRLHVSDWEQREYFGLL